MRENLLQIFEDPEVELVTIADALARLEKVPNDETNYNSTYIWVRRKFGPYYKGGREKFKAFLERAHQDPSRLHPRQNPEKTKQDSIPKYGSMPYLAGEYLRRIQRPDRVADPDDYTGTEGGMKFLRYYGLHRRKYEKDTALFTRKFDEEFGDVVPQVVQRRMPDELRGLLYNTHLTLEDAKRLRIEVSSVDYSYNTEDGLIRWLLDHDYKNIHLQGAFSAVPRKVKERMTEWKQMAFSVEKAVEIREALENIPDSYNTPDGLTRWMEDYFPDLHPVMLRSVIPPDVKERMSEWGLVSTRGSYEDLAELSTKFQTNLDKPHRAAYPERYEGREGGILFLRFFSRFSRNRHFAPKTIASSKQLPEKLRERITIPTLVYKDILEVRNKIRTIDNSYNTEDGQIRWLMDSGLARIGLYSFWVVIPRQVRERMTNWRRMGLSTQKAAAIYSALGKVDDSYNTIDGQVRWLRDHDFGDTSPALFWKVVPTAVRTRMTEWRPLPYTLENAKIFIKDATRIRKILREKYGLEDISAERRIATFLVRARVPQKEIGKVLRDSFKHADALINELALARVITGDQKALDIRDTHQLYAFASERFGLSPASVWVILRLKRLSLIGIRGIVSRGERQMNASTSLDQPSERQDGRQTPLSHRIGYEDPGFARVEAKLTLEAILKENHLAPEQAKLLEKVIDGDDLEDTEYESLAEVIKRHPELMEILNEEDE